MKLGSALFSRHDLVAEGLLTPEQLRSAQEVTRSHAGRTTLSGISSTSLGLSGGAEEIEVHVLPGNRIREYLPWLDELYRTELMRLASEYADRRMYPSRDLRSGVNVNWLQGKGAQYEWHCDSNPVTGLLFLNTLAEGEGGELVFRTEAGEEVVRPVAGQFLAFDAREVAHCVRPLGPRTFRMSAPMNFYLSETDQPRPDDLDDYLYAFETLEEGPRPAVSAALGGPGGAGVDRVWRGGGRPDPAS